MKKNNLENLYQEKLKDFKEAPDKRVWEAITASLDKKEKKRILPIWWKLGGIAAALILFVYLINPFKSTIPVNQTSDVELNTDKNQNKTEEPFKYSNGTSNPIELTTTKSIKKTGETQTTQAKSNTQESSIASGTRTKGLTNNKTQKNWQDNPIKNKEQLTSTKNKGAQKEIPQNTKSRIAPKIIDERLNTQKDVVAKNNKEKHSLAPDQKQNTDKELSNKKEAVVAVDLEDNDKKSIFDAIKEQDAAIVENKKDKWSVGPSVAPVYFNAVGEGSPIHSSFVENSKSGNVNLSYGLTVAYNLGKRLKVSSGIHKVDYGYDTNDVVFSSSITANSSSTIDNIDFSQTSSTIVVESKQATAGLSDLSSNDFIAQSPQREGRMSQQIGYLEVPLELNYTLIDKKFGVNVIGGFSSLFLVNNTVSLESEGLITQIGEANNLNALNFSGNFGLGFNYEISPKVQINLEPVFKYQLNTFSNTAGSFNPYTVGVYSGLRFNF